MLSVPVNALISTNTQSRGIGETPPYSHREIRAIVGCDRISIALDTKPNDRTDRAKLRNIQPGNRMFVHFDVGVECRGRAYLNLL